jgi:hypothetical protein
MLWRGPIGGGAASGKAGAMVASHNASGQHLRARTTPTNPRSAFQTAVRNAVRQLSPAWNSLTDLQRQGWSVYATNTAMKNRLGDTIFLSGIAQYVRSNVSRLQAGLARVDDAPTTFTLGDVPGYALLAPPFSTAGTLTLDADASTDWRNQTDNSMLVYVSRPQNAGVTFFNGPYQLATVIPSSSTMNSFAVTLPFATSDTTSKYFTQSRISRGDGRLSGTFQTLEQPV